MKADVLIKQLLLQLLLNIVFNCQSISQGFSSQTEARLQHVIDSFQNNPANPYVGGMSAAIKVDGLAYWQGATGYAARNVDGSNNLLPGGIPFTTSTLSRMYSVTKTFTASLVLELAKDGAFSLDDRVTDHIPFLNAINHELNGAVTIKQLLAHESGYSSYSDEFMLQVAVAFQPTHEWTAFEALSFVHQINAPGSVRSYSNTNYIVLGAIIEIATGKPIEQHYRERFFTSLNFSSMYMDAREPQWPGSLLASPHDNISPFNPIFLMTGQPVFPNAFTNISAFPFTAISTLEFSSGGLVTNIADLAEWGNSLFGGRATSQSTIDAMMNSISLTPDADGDFLGYGIFRTTRISSSDEFIGHDGNAPGYSSVMFYQPDRKMTIAILTNYRGARLYDVAKALFEALPDFLCGNRNKKEDKIIVCHNGNNLCVDRKAAAGFIERGAYLGGCHEVPLTKTNRNEVSGEATKLILGGKVHVYPNPASGSASVSFIATGTRKVRLDLYDMNGKLVKNILEGVLNGKGRQTVAVQTKDLQSGVYIVNLREGNSIIGQTKLLITN